MKKVHGSLEGKGMLQSAADLCHCVCEQVEPTLEWTQMTPATGRSDFCQREGGRSICLFLFEQKSNGVT